MSVDLKSRHSAESQSKASRSYRFSINARSRGQRQTLLYFSYNLFKIWPQNLCSLNIPCSSMMNTCSDWYSLSEVAVTRRSSQLSSGFIVSNIHIFKRASLQKGPVFSPYSIVESWCLKEIGNPQKWCVSLYTMRRTRDVLHSLLFNIYHTCEFCLTQPLHSFFITFIMLSWIEKHSLSLFIELRCHWNMCHRGDPLGVQSYSLCLSSPPCGLWDHLTLLLSPIYRPHW